MVVSITGGLGANDDEIAALFGLTFMFWQNLGLNAHVIGKNQKVLNGRYNEGDIISENLDFDQLHESRFNLHWGLSVSYRFKNNPFSKDE